MSRYFVPYAGDKPAAINVNGHRLLILAKEKGSLEDELEIMGADSLKTIKVGGGKEAESRALNKLAKNSKAGLVIAPDELELKDVLRNLEFQLPWLQ